MEKKIKVKQLGIGFISCIIVIGMLLVGIKEDLVGMETALFVGTGVLILLMKEPVWLIYLQILYCCVNKFIISQFGAPDAINYVTDVLMILSFLMALKQLYEKRKKTYLGVPLVFAALFFGLGTISAILHEVPILLLLWSYRNLMRFFLFLFSCVVLLNYEDVERLGKIFPFCFS